MGTDEALELSKTIADGFDQPCRAMIDQGIMPRVIVGAFLLKAFDLMLDEGEDAAATLQAFNGMADTLARVRLDQMNIPNPRDN